MTTLQIQHDMHLKATLLYKIGLAHAALEHHTQAITSLNESYQILEGDGAGTPLEIVTILEYLEASYKKVAGQEDKAADAHSKIDSIVTAVADSTNMRNLTDLADYYVANDRLSDAEAVFAHTQMVLEQDKQDEPPDTQTGPLARSLSRLGRAYENKDVYDKALRAYQQASQLVDPKVDAHFYGVIMHDIGDVYLAQKDLTQALAFYNKASEYKDHDLRTTLISIGDIHAELRQHGEAITAYEHAIDRVDRFLT